MYLVVFVEPTIQIDNRLTTDGSRSATQKVGVSASIFLVCTICFYPSQSVSSPTVFRLIHSALFLFTTTSRFFLSSQTLPVTVVIATVHYSLYSYVIASSSLPVPLLDNPLCSHSNVCPIHFLCTLHILVLLSGISIAFQGTNHGPKQVAAGGVALVRCQTGERCLDASATQSGHPERCRQWTPDGSG